MTYSVFEGLYGNKILCIGTPEIDGVNDIHGFCINAYILNAIVVAGYEGNDIVRYDRLQVGIQEIVSRVCSTTFEAESDEAAISKFVDIVTSDVCWWNKINNEVL